ncbi:MAG: nuclear transport factor 2 family protein [Henriciella sp.]
MTQPKNLDADLKRLIDKDAIRDCLYRYCRGIDRADEALLRSTYWPDGTDHHGPYQGDAMGFVDWAMKTLPYIERGIHQIHNVLIEFKPGGAAVESYFSAFQRQLGAERQMQQWDMKGRYLDWFVERDGEWRVLNRIVVFDWVEEMPLPKGTEAERFGPRTPIGALYPDDLVYSIGPIA